MQNRIKLYGSRIVSRMISGLLGFIMICGTIVLSPMVSAGTYNGFDYVVEDDEATITGFSGSGNVTIPSIIDGHTVTKIGERAFLFKPSLTGVVIPDSVKTIGDYSFSLCKNLKNVTIGNGVREIGKNAFSEANSLKELKIGNSVKTIGEGAFSQCFSLTDVVIPNSVESIGNSSFAYGTSLKSVKLGTNIIEIGPGAFTNCPILSEITLEKGNKSFVVIDEVLYDKDVKTLLWCPNSKDTVKIPDSVTAIYSYAFGYCDNIKKLVFPDNLKTIEYSAFLECSLTEITIPDSVTEIDLGAFAFCKSLKTVKLGGGIAKISTGLFMGCSSLETVAVPSGVTSIEEKAFEDCSSLKSVTVPESVTSIGADSFQGCNNLDDIFFGGSRDEWSTISKDVAIPRGVTVHCSNGSTIGSLRFTDVKSGSFYEEAVKWAVENKITEGTSRTLFSPDDACTRGQVVTFLWRAKGESEPKSFVNQFADVKDSDYYFKPVLWAVENNITKGTSNNYFSPTVICTRGQIVTFLWRAAGEPEPEKKENLFDDVNKNDFYYKAVLWAEENEITKGTSTSKFSPNDTCTRGQIVTFLWRASK